MSILKIPSILIKTCKFWILSLEDMRLVLSKDLILFLFVLELFYQCFFNTIFPFLKSFLLFHRIFLCRGWNHLIKNSRLAEFSFLHSKQFQLDDQKNLPFNLIFYCKYFLDEFSNIAYRVRHKTCARSKIFCRPRFTLWVNNF